MGGRSPVKGSRNDGPLPHEGVGVAACAQPDGVRWTASPSRLATSAAATVVFPMPTSPSATIRPPEPRPVARPAATRRFGVGRRHGVAGREVTARTDRPAGQCIGDRVAGDARVDGQQVDAPTSRAATAPSDSPATVARRTSRVTASS